MGIGLQTLLAAVGVLAVACHTAQPPGGAGSEFPAPGQEPTYLVVYRAGARWPAGESLPEPLREHFRYLLSLHRQGALRLAGPFGNETGGAAVFTAIDDAAALAVLRADPAVRAQIFDFELRRWSLVDWAQQATAPPK